MYRLWYLHHGSWAMARVNCIKNNILPPLSWDWPPPVAIQSEIGVSGPNYLAMNMNDSREASLERKQPWRIREGGHGDITDGQMTVERWSGQPKDKRIGGQEDSPCGSCYMACDWLFGGSMSSDGSLTPRTRCCHLSWHISASWAIIRDGAYCARGRWGAICKSPLSCYLSNSTTLWRPRKQRPLIQSDLFRLLVRAVNRIMTVPFFASHIWYLYLKSQSRTVRTWCGP